MQIKITNLSKSYKEVVAVDNISLNINSNEIFSLLGVNGAGKTTTIKMLTGLVQKDCGEIVFGNLKMGEDTDKIKQIINLSPQETAIAENLSVKENLLFLAEVYALRKEEAKNKAEELIKTFNLQSVQNKRAKFLSGGMKRRLSIAMALVSNPKVLFLDEPTLGLDVLVRAELWSLIKSLKSQMTVILTTHYMEEAEQLSDRVAIMNDGKIIEQGSPKQLKTKYDCESLEKAFIKIVEGRV